MSEEQIKIFKNTYVERFLKLSLNFHEKREIITKIGESEKNQPLRGIGVLRLLPHVTLIFTMRLNKLEET